MLFAVCLMTAMTAALLCINPQHRVMDVALPDNNLFVINLWWAGAWRRVVIDGNLPVDQWGRTVFASCEDHSRSVPLVLRKKKHKHACDLCRSPMHLNL